MTSNTCISYFKMRLQHPNCCWILTSRTLRTPPKKRPIFISHTFTYPVLWMPGDSHPLMSTWRKTKWPRFGISPACNWNVWVTRQQLLSFGVWIETTELNHESGSFLRTPNPKRRRLTIFRRPFKEFNSRVVFLTYIILGGS